MEPNNNDERRKIFRKELFTLKEEGFLSEKIVEHVASAHHQYYLNLAEKEAIPALAGRVTQKTKPAPAKPEKEKKMLTPEQVREKNITWLLNIGVILLLIGGLFVATSNWQSMTSFMKSGSIAIVSFLFYVIALLTNKVLHIKKTAFAFTVLGSLFLPIFIFSLGWFGLLGSYLSIYGEGRNFLGMLGSFLPLSVYLIFAKSLRSRLFVWFSFISFSAGVAFLLAGTKLTIDYFYFGIMAFNSILIFVYHKLKNNDSLQLFTKEFVPFVQVNLVLSTLFMLIFFQKEVLYGFNLLLTAIIYLSMMYVSGKKEYHFVFSMLVVYGAYQLIEHSFLEHFGAIVYALIGFGVVIVPKVLGDQFSINNAFQYTSAVISGVAFIYISLEGIILRAGNPSLVLMIAYFVIATNFIYLSHHNSRRIFPYLSSIFVGTGIYETIAVLVDPFNVLNFTLTLAITGIILVRVFGMTNLFPVLKIIQTPSREIGIGIYTIAIIHVLLSTSNQFWVQPLVLLVGIGMYYYFYKMIGQKWVAYAISITTLLAYFSIIYAIELNVMVNPTMNSLIASGSALTMLLIAYPFRKIDRDLSYAFAWTGHIILPLALAFTWFAYHSDSVYSFILAFCGYAINTKLAECEGKIKVFLYGSFTALFFIVSTSLDRIITQTIGQFEFPITSGLIFIFSLFVSGDLKQRTALYFVPFSIIGINCMLVTYPFAWLAYCLTGVYSFGVLFYLHKNKWDVIGIVPLFLLFAATVEFTFFSDMSEPEKLLLSGGLGILMTIIGQFVSKKVFAIGVKLQEINIDGFTIISFLYFWFMYFFTSQQLWSQALPGVLISATFWLQRKRVPVSASVFMPMLGGAYLLEPYYAIIRQLNIPPLWEREVRVLPFIILVIFIRRILKGRYSDTTKAIQWGILIIVSLLLVQDGITSNTIYDAIIVGALSLISMIAGMVLQVKSYFFVGSGVLLLNVFLQTRPYWGNMPWWVYLLISGLILITVASFNEWHKQKGQKGETTFITLLKKKVKDKIKKWD